MNNLTFKKLEKECQEKLLGLAKKNSWLWFYNLHQKEAMNCAKDLLKIYKKADAKMVIIACWLHDISKYYAKNTKDFEKVHKNHHIESAEIAKQFLIKNKLNSQDVDKIANIILKHRNSLPYKAETIEEKIMVVADTLSHFESVLYFIHFKFYPKRTIEDGVKMMLLKLDRDWRDLAVLPKSRKLVGIKYKVLKEMLENYQK